MPAHPAAPLWACCCPAPPGPHSAGLLSRHSSPNLCLSLDYLTSSCVGFTRQSVGSRVGCCWGGLCGCQLHFKANVEDFISASKQIDKDIHSVLDWVVSLWSFKQHHQSGRESRTQCFCNDRPAKDNSALCSSQFQNTEKCQWRGGVPVKCLPCSFKGILWV